MKSGFVNIIGRPNVGKSTLMNALVGERMSIITNKPQTTRHRILGILSGDGFQVIFSDTPGVIDDPHYKMQEAMNSFVKSSFEDADVVLFVTEVGEVYAEDDPLMKRLQTLKVPLFLVLNKIDLAEPTTVLEQLKIWNERLTIKECFPISALKKNNTKPLLDHILRNLPEGPAWYPEDQLTDKPERFFVSEIIREKILLNYRQEIPYSCEVIVEAFQEDPKKNLIRIGATIYVMRKTQKGIIIGNKGEAIKKLGTDARKDLETFLEKRVYLELFVKVKENWRDDDSTLKHFGYQ